MISYLYANINSFTKEDYENAYLLMHPTRKKRIDSLKQPADKKRSLAGEIILKNLLSTTHNLPQNTPIILSDEKGKPYCQNLPLHVSISHSGDIAMCAISSKRVGIDIELLRPIDLKLADHFCLQNEKEYIFSHNKGQLERLYEIWTIKEAYFKMLGTGITDFFSVNALSDKIKKERITLDGYIAHLVTE